MPSHKGPIRELSDTQLLEEWDYWSEKIDRSPSWGAGVAAADEFRRDCENEIQRRGIARKGKSKMPNELKEQPTLIFKGGKLTFNRKGYGLRNNRGTLSFNDDDLVTTGDDIITRNILLDSTDLIAIRDFLIEYVR